MEIAEILQKEGPMISGKLTERISELNAIELNAAKKRLSRAIKPINKLKLGFIKNQSFVFLEDQKNESRFWKELFENLKEYSKAYFAVLNSLIIHHGYLEESQIPIYTFSPILPLKGHKKIEIIINSLKICGLISTFDEKTVQLVSNGIFYLDYKKYRAIQIAKKQVLQHFAEWARKVNFTKWNNEQSCDKPYEFFKFQWSFVSTSYLNGLAVFNTNNPIPGFIIADVIIGQVVSLKDIEYFINKIKILKEQKKIRTFLPIFLCELLEDKALKQLRSNGIFVGRVEELFGEEYSKTLKLLIDTLSQFDELILKEPEKFLFLQNELDKYNGLFRNLKGDLFEFVVAYYFTLLGDKVVEVGRLIKLNNSHNMKKEMEIDVWAESINGIRIIECKWQNSPLNFDYIDDWIRNTIPAIRKWIIRQPTFNRKKISFEIWSMSGFDDEIKKNISEKLWQTKASKYEIKYYDSNQIKEKFRDLKSSKLNKIIKNYFRKNEN